ncbi:hypothetical protein ABIA00_000018 [Bradyrhizobium ottawaense]|uniref:hypothetical protein n=1 Tax=Bradyrhizobium ottawaense TaxID=931866 RepID=UPI003836D605
MKREELPMMVDVLKQAKQSEAVARASLWAIARMAYALRNAGVLSDSDVEIAFDPKAIGSAISEEFHDIAEQAIDHLRHESLGPVERR